MSLETENLSFHIKEKTLIHGISLNFLPGILYGVIGPNGSGKTTLLKTLPGIWKPTAGHVRWQGTDLSLVSRKEISRLITLVPQNPSMHFDFTVQEIVAMGRYPHTTGRGNESTESALKRVNGWDLRNAFLSELSGGERQRVYIARALATEAPIMLLDEPTSCLDLRHQLEIWKLLQELASQGKLVIAAVHDLVAAQRYCAQLAVLQEGQCVAVGPSSAVITNELLFSVFGVDSLSG